MKTKKQVIKEMIDNHQEDLYKMEIVRDYQSTIETPQAREQVNSAKKRIEDITKQMEWLKQQ